MAELKLLDPNRKAVLQLPDPAFKLWMAYWMHESDDQEVYTSLDRLEAATGQSRNTVLKWRDYLLSAGWLVQKEGFASDRYSKPTRGSHTVKIYSVDDPVSGNAVVSMTNDAKGSRREPFQTRKSSSGEPFQVGEEKGFTTFTPHETNLRFMSVSVSSSLPEALAESVSMPTTTSAYADGSEQQSLRSLTTQDLRPKQTTTKTKTSASGVKIKHNSKYDVPFPYDFTVWSQIDRTRWCIEHLLPAQGSVLVQGQNNSDPVQVEGSFDNVQTPAASAPPTVPLERRASPPTTPPPPAAFSCGACEYSAKYRASLAEHMEKEHPELPQLWLGPLKCPHCQWKKFYLDGDREKNEIMLAEHVIEQHRDRI